MGEESPVPSEPSTPGPRRPVPPPSVPEPWWKDKRNAVLVLQMASVLVATVVWVFVLPAMEESTWAIWDPGEYGVVHMLLGFVVFLCGYIFGAVREADGSQRR